MTFQAETDKRLSLAFLVLFAAATLYLSFVIARPFLTPILSATLIAIAIYPLYLRLSRRFQNRSGAALLATLAVLIAIASGKLSRVGGASMSVVFSIRHSNG